MSEVCRDTEIEPKLTPLSGEELQGRPSNNSNESINGSMGRQCQTFYSRLAHTISEKKDLPLLILSNWIRTKVYFRLPKSSLLCLRGSRTVCRKTAEFEIDVDYLTRSPKYKLDHNHKTNIDTFGVFFVNFKLVTALAANK